MKTMTDEMYIAFPDLNLAKRKAKALTAMIQPLPAHLSLESCSQVVNSYLYRSRNEALIREIRALNNKQSQFNNMVLKFEYDFLMYNLYNLVNEGKYSRIPEWE